MLHENTFHNLASCQCFTKTRYYVLADDRGFVFIAHYMENVFCLVLVSMKK